MKRTEKTDKILVNPTESAALKRLEHDLIKEDGIVPATKGRHAIHCLTVIGGRISWSARSSHLQTTPET